MTEIASSAGTASTRPPMPPAVRPAASPMAVSFLFMGSSWETAGVGALRPENVLSDRDVHIVCPGRKK